MRVILKQREQARLMVFNEVERGGISGEQAAEVLQLSLRHVRRLLAAYRRKGAAALAHGNRGRVPWNALKEEVKEQVTALVKTKYAGVNTQHFTELLAEREGIRLSRSSVRQIRLEAGLNSPRKRRAPRHRSRRERYPREGMLLQIDGSRHDWLQGRGPYLTLIGAIDDATGSVPYALFREQEDTQGYFLLLRGITAGYGIPLALYHDQHSIFEPTVRRPETIEEQLEGKRHTSHFGRLMMELGIESITALSPQAKGRIERLWGTFQDRLVSELRLAAVNSLEAANKVLGDFLPRYNARFTIEAAEPGSAYREPDPSLVYDEVFCFKYQSMVSGDNVVRFGKHRLQILPSRERISYAHARVEVHERLDGSLGLFYQGRCLLTTPAPPEAPVIRAHKHGISQPKIVNPPSNVTCPIGTKITRPAPDHPWRGIFRVHVDGG